MFASFCSNSLFSRARVLMVWAMERLVILNLSCWPIWSYRISLLLCLYDTVCKVAAIRIQSLSRSSIACCNDCFGASLLGVSRS